MERTDLVTIPLQLKSGTVKHFRTHPGTDADEGAASWLLKQEASDEWFAEHSLDDTIFLGVGDSSQRHVINEHLLRDQHGIHTDCCTTLTAKALGVDGNRLYHPLLNYILGQDAFNKGTPFDMSQALKYWRMLQLDNTAGIEWFHTGLDLWRIEAETEVDLPDELRSVIGRMGGGLLDIKRLASIGRRFNPAGIDVESWFKTGLDVFVEAEKRIVAAIEWVRINAEPHSIQIRDKKFTFWVVRSDDPFVTYAFRRLERAAGLYVRIESSGHFQIFTHKSPRLLEAVWRRLIHRVYRNMNFMAPAVLQKTFIAQMKWCCDEQPAGMQAWEKWLYIHRDSGSIFNGSMTARPEPLLGNGLVTRDVIEVLESAILHSVRFKSEPARRHGPNTPTPTPQPTETTAITEPETPAPTDQANESTEVTAT